MRNVKRYLLIFHLFINFYLFYGEAALCESDEWKCNDNCIPNIKLCDHHKDCADNSDENSRICQFQLSHKKVLTGNQSRCRITYNVNLLISNADDNKQSIILPGDYVQHLESIKYSCPTDHLLIGSKSNYCINGEWTDKSPICKKHCSNSIFRSDTVQSICELHGARVSCYQPIVPGTQVTIECSFGYQKIGSSGRDRLLCEDNGLWNNPPYRCEQICGELHPNINSFILGGSKTNNTNVPWHVGIYSNLNQPNQQICGGTIISSRIVISAAHCFWNLSNSQLNDATLYKVGAGKYYRDFYANEPLRVQFADVLEIVIPDEYQDLQLSFISDIAVLLLKTPLKFMFYVKPACIKWGKYEEKSMPSNIIGKVAGWGQVKIGVPSKELNTVELSSLSYTDCLHSLQAEYKSSITGDKFCVSSTNGETVCRGDSGGGFVASEYMNGVKRFFLQGIVSNGINVNKECTGDFLTAYTNIQHYDKMIQSYMENDLNGCLDSSTENNKFCIRKRMVLSHPTSQTPLSNSFQGHPEEQSERCLITFDKTLKVHSEGDNPEEILTGDYIEEYQSIKYSCQEGFLILGSTTNYCVGGNWLEPNPICHRYCKNEVLRSATTHSTCEYNKDVVSCEKPLLAGTRVGFTCQFGYRKPTFGFSDYLQCGDNGKWNGQPHRCEQECGEETLTIEPFILRGYDTNSTKVPWHVGIYSSVNKENEIICSGTIISARIVISAAHCFWNRTTSSPNLEAFYKVGAGKYYRQYDAEEHFPVQFSDVKEIHIPQEFEGMKSAFISNIAVVVLKTFLKFSYNIKPACLKSVSDEKAVKPNIIGRVSGWGITETGLPSDELKSVELSTLSYIDCFQKVKPSLRHFITGDKFCTSTINEKTVCRGDSGAGFLIPETDIYGFKRFILLGIVSNGLPGNTYFDHECSGDLVSAFTNIQLYQKFIDKYMIQFKVQ